MSKANVVLRPLPALLLLLLASAPACQRVIPTLAVGESFETRFRRSDLATADLRDAYGYDEVTLQTAIEIAKPQNCVDGGGAPIPCYEFSRFGCRWLPVPVDNPGTATVRATGTRDYMMICEAPDGTLFGSDDFDTTECVNNGDCDPGMVITGAGVWTCFFTVSPYDTLYYPTNDPVGGVITVTVEP